MSDIGLTLFENGSIDVLVQNNDLAVDDGLKTAVLISLFTDRRVDSDDLPPEESSLRGWWADQFPDVPGDLIGSRLWLLKREKRTVETLNRAVEYSIEALNWMVEDGVADSLDVSADYDDNGALMLTITIMKPKDKDATTFRFKPKWNAEQGS